MTLGITVVLLFFVTDSRPAHTSSNKLESSQRTRGKKEQIGKEKPLRRKRIINTNELTDELNLCNFNTTEKNVCLPDFEEWKNIHAAWHRPENSVNAQLLGQLIISYLDKHSHSREQCDKSPTTCDWCRISNDVGDFVEQLMDQVALLCPLFTAHQLIHTGSSADKTNIFQASEFDHLVILEHFSQSASDPNQIVYTGSDSVALKYGTALVNVTQLLNLFRECISEAAEVVQSDRLFYPKTILGRTGVTIYFIYAGRSETMRISLDIAIGVKVTQQLPQIWFVKHNSKKDDVVLVPQHPIAGNRWRLSYPTLERDTLLRADASVGRVYQLLKFLAALHHSKNNVMREIPRKSSLTTYVLKTCLFDYMRQCYRPDEAPWLDKDAVQHAVGTLEYFPLNATVMTSFFNKDIVEFNITLESKQAATEIIDRLERMNN